MFTADQTPTPTRLIRNCEEIGLFEMLNHVNPFDETFRRAVEAKSTATTPNEVGTIGDDNAELTILERTDNNDNHLNKSSEETLNTPHVLPYYDVTAADCRFVASPMDHHQRTLCETVDKWRSNVPPSSSAASSNLIEPKTKSTEPRSKLIRKCEKPAQTVISAASSTTLAAVDRTVTSRPSSETIKMPKLVRLSPPTTAVIEKRISPVIVHAQVLMKAIPKLIELSSPEPSRDKNELSIPQRNMTTIEIDGESETEMSETRITTSQNIRDKLKRQIYDKTNPDDPLASKRSHSECHSATIQATSVLLSVRRECSNAVKSPDEPKPTGERFERNRAAAQRYRSKMKEWKVEMQMNNSRLEEENRSLRSEVVRLNALLLAHQKCSVTKAMEQGIWRLCKMFNCHQTIKLQCYWAFKLLSRKLHSSRTTENCYSHNSFQSSNG